MITIIINFAPQMAFAQTKCGGLNQTPCPVSEKVNSCNKGLREDYRKDRCVSAKSIAGTSFLKLCNNDSKEVISFIIVLWNSELKKWKGEGWYKIDDRECTVTVIPGGYQGYVKVYAEMKSKTWTGNNGSFCVPKDLTKIFRGIDNTDCRPPNFKRVDLFSILFEPSVSKTFYLKNSANKTH
ncbi:MAG TPA: DUF1036 domain-containing protein [Pyrinomonadaceae bacterium]|nr:DUF1036 domain-containing protein [Pyrinomonadaceae bacterium]